MARTPELSPDRQMLLELLRDQGEKDDWTTPLMGAIGGDAESPAVEGDHVMAVAEEVSGVGRSLATSTDEAICSQMDSAMN